MPCPGCGKAVKGIEPISSSETLQKLWLAHKVDCERGCGARNIKIKDLEAHALVCDKLRCAACLVQVLPLTSLEVGLVLAI